MPHASRHAKHLAMRSYQVFAKMTPEQLSVAVQSHITQIGVAPPPERAAGIKVEDVSQLVDKLKNEAKVI